MIKIIGCIIIVLACSGLGFMLAARYKMRVLELRSIKMSLQILETEIAYSNTPLPDAFYMVSTKSSAPVNTIFVQMSTSLKEKNHSTVGEAFSKTIDEIREKMSITNEDIDILKSFGNSLGCSDTDGQIKNFNMAIKQLENQELKAEESRLKNERMYKNLGILAGLAIAIIFL